MSTPYNKNTIRALLEKHEDGLTVTEISQLTGIATTSAYIAVKRDERIYVDRWTNSAITGQWIAVWCLAPRLEDAPRPSIKPSQYLQSMAVVHV